ncbi:alpha tubulin suppressor [Yamadazyma tenuis]|uniref:RCC1/BLIP-II protein n=1 Tax=Candida tenuis (strain ATCC 10573 / BCRC 21748 / CBS 615 / JCM 9827 / NBRC 10315 / NRRL Y-1498 / VKM Y-70) TaxID=590646 RepID=G3B2H1_CANTC|nr:uncharacterized protein CANTEDRAFT_120507 [Yamadazyma tenuis ATCC 10573]EGV64673.1 hypothetical protein CANTEDRAFT_120507 [Yamadazyma tenuis ATCC 10573]WEJ97463.1 alpha tubulin suppressor [Yamadazyma tenuis]
MKLLACGSNGHYQLGNGTNIDTNQLTPASFTVDGHLVDLPSSVAKIATGGNHTFVLLNSGSLYTCGDNSYGQCGLPPADHIAVFTPVPGQWRDVSCGWEYSILVDATDNVFVCGLGLKGELGLGESTTSTVLTRLDAMCGRGISVVSSMSLTLCRASDGKFYGWGDGKKGQLGAKKVRWVPEVVVFPVQEEILHFGLTKTDAVLQLRLRLVSFGRQAIDIPQKVHFFRTMWTCIHYEVEAEPCSVVSVGNNSHGQHFPNSWSQCGGVFETGSEHGLFYANNTVYAWGWGEHGNCGHSQVQGHDQIVFADANAIFKGKPAYMAGGCATSWIATD